MKTFFGARLYRAVFALVGLTATVGGPVPAAAPTLGAFTSNGCSVFPDSGDSFSCCYVHDFQYFTGGTAADRRSADRALHTCVVSATSNQVTAGLMYLGVSLFGLPGVPTRVQWGYGWGDSRQTSYEALSKDEQAQVDAHRRELCRGFTPIPNTGDYLIDGTHRIRGADARRMCPGF